MWYHYISGCWGTRPHLAIGNTSDREWGSVMMRYLIVWRWPSFDLHAMVAWHSGWAIKSNWRSGLVSSDVLSRSSGSSGLYGDSVPRWEVHSCTWHVTLTSDISCTLADTLFMMNFVKLPGFKDIFTSDGFVNPGKYMGQFMLESQIALWLAKHFLFLSIPGQVVISVSLTV